MIVMLKLSKIVGEFMDKEIIITAKDIANRKKKYNNLKLILSIIFIILILAFIILSVIYNGGKFTVTLDPALALESGIVIYDDPEIKEGKRKLTAKNLEFMDNISIDWIPQNIDNESNGTHNGENYIAYTFYIENQGKEVINYWYSVVIDDVIKNVDEAARVMIYLNGERSLYAKINSYTKEAEKDTKVFFSDEEAVLEQRRDFKPGDIDKFTVVIWLEGDDPDCVDSILGGEIKMHMEIREEHKEQENGKEEK